MDEEDGAWLNFRRIFVLQTMFTEQEQNELSLLIKRYEKPQAALLPVLWRIQEKQGWIDQDGMQEAAKICGVPKSHVLGVVSFYTMFFEKPMGRHHVQVCTNVSCMIRGGEKIYDTMKECLGIGHLERTPDGLFSLEEVECMGACGGAPMIAVGERFFEKVTAEDAAAVVQQIRNTGTVPAPIETVQLPELTNL
ncbi:MAG: NAD(P)H-dependent oxidoreductase subunit E [Bacteroidota bacterium]|nr:NAD(P)H-dependent oxidoreductase subunit E [Bacteroidota bacterium]MDP4235381.1 NAD(P)H-dependent oxidoreductase subunit E [Bacteroidota bacterium]